MGYADSTTLAGFFTGAVFLAGAALGVEIGVVFFTGADGFWVDELGFVAGFVPLLELGEDGLGFVVGFEATGFDLGANVLGIQILHKQITTNKRFTATHRKPGSTVTGSTHLQDPSLRCTHTRTAYVGLGA
jgi:hypothetical protein